MIHGWSLEREHWEVVRELANGRSWQRVRLREWDRERVPTTSGIYAVCARLPANGPGDLLAEVRGVVYVGRATSIRTRFTAHYREPMHPMQKALECFGPAPLEFWYLEAPPTEIEALEAAFIRALGPPANRISGSISAIAKPPVPLGTPNVGGRR